MLMANGGDDDLGRAKHLLNEARATARELGMAKVIADVELQIPLDTQN
jgi:hypothetical protein